MFRRAKNCTPKLAMLAAVILFLLAFWGTFYFLTRFWEIGRYSVPQEAKTPGNEEKVDADGKIRQYLEERSQKRQRAAMPLILGAGERDPFALP